MTATEVWGIGSFGDAEGSTHSLMLTTAEFDREVDVAERRLAALGVGADDIVLVIAGVAEAVQFAPFQRAARRLGGISCTAEPSPFDARRTASFLEQYSLRAVVGLDAAVLEGLEELGDAAEMLRRCEVLVARADAVPRLRELGLDPLTLRVLGPTVAVDCPHRAGAHVGRDAWVIAESDGGLVVTPAPGRALDLEMVDTGRRGTVVTEPCACGSADPRVIIEQREDPTR